MSEIGFFFWLLETLVSAAAQGEREGAAQGLAEVLAALGDEKLEGLMPTLLEGAARKDARAREGFALLWVQLPSTLGERFARHLVDVLPLVLSGLADEAEPVREACLQAARKLTGTYLETAAALFLPKLRQGLGSHNYRVRYASVALLGELLERLTNGEPITIPESHEEVPPDAPLAMLPTSEQHDLLAALYISRSDAADRVRSAASTSWKALVSNTPRALRIILPELTRQLISGIASDDDEPQLAAARALGDLVAKLGERVLPTLIPILQEGLRERDDAHRAGVCLGLKELVAAAGREHVGAFLEPLVIAVRIGLCDESEIVAEGASEAFSALQRLLGGRAVEGIVSTLLGLIRAAEGEEEAARGRRGLRLVVAQRPASILPFLLPKLLAPPLSTASALALEAVAAVSRDAIHYHLDTLLPALLAQAHTDRALAPEAEAYDAERSAALAAAAQAVALAVQQDGLHLLLPVLLQLASAESPSHTRAAAAALIAAFSEKSKLELVDWHAEMMRSLLMLFGSPTPALVQSGWSALDRLVKTLDKERYLLHVSSLREAIRDLAREMVAARAQLAKSHAKSHPPPTSDALSLADATPPPPLELPGLCLPKGLAPILAIQLHGLMCGSAELRETAATALGEAIELTSASALKPFVITITGPLIRIVGDRFAAPVKAAILQSLRLLIGKGNILLKPFVPQLQSSFVKALHDPSELLRSRGIAALAALAPISTRVEALFTDLIAQIATVEPPVRHAMLCTLSAVLRATPKPISEALLDKVVELALSHLLDDEDAAVGLAAAAALAAAARWRPLTPLLERVEAACEGAPGGRGLQAELRVHLAALRGLGNGLSREHLAENLPTLLAAAEQAAAHEGVDIRRAAAHATARLAVLMGTPEDCEEQSTSSASLHASAAAVPYRLFTALASLLADDSREVRVSALHAAKRLCKLRPSLLRVEGSAAALAIVPKAAALAHNKSDTVQQLAAQRLLMHLLRSARWTEVNGFPREGLGKEVAEQLNDFIRRNLKRIAAMESEEELSDEGPR